VVADKGYHAADTLELSEFTGLRTYIPEPKRKHERRWTDKPAEFQQAVYNNRRRMRRKKGKQLQRTRSELCERTFAHICDTGGGRRTWLRGLINVTKRYLIAAAGHNLGRIMRKLFGVGKPKNLQVGSDLAVLVQFILCGVQIALQTVLDPVRRRRRHPTLAAA
jgi:transposase